MSLSDGQSGISGSYKNKNLNKIKPKSRRARKDCGWCVKNFKNEKNIK